MTECPSTSGGAQPGQPSPKHRRAAGYARSATTPNPESIQRQIEAIGRYADGHGMHVVRIYRDEGKSGLRMDDRPGLQQLFRDAGNCGKFDAVLLLDPSRWGRFIDAHEIVADEFTRRNADIEIHYCAEQFAQDHSPVFSIVQAIKRGMAREYDRELSCRRHGGTGAAARRRMAAALEGCTCRGPAREAGERSDPPASTPRSRASKPSSSRIEHRPAPGKHQR